METMSAETTPAETMSAETAPAETMIAETAPAETSDRDRPAPRSGARWFYAGAAVAGTVIPWIFFGSFLATEGLDLVGFGRSLFPNGAAGGFSADIFISAAVFWVWSFRDSRIDRVERWWLVVPATLFVGLSLALPLYLFWREGAVPASRR